MSTCGCQPRGRSCSTSTSARSAKTTALLTRRLGATPAAGVVKADGYGLGAADGRAGARRRRLRARFFVAHLGEALALRAAAGRHAPTILC